MQSKFVKLFVLMGLMGCSDLKEIAQEPSSYTKKGDFPTDQTHRPLLEKVRYIGGDSREFFEDHLQDDYWEVVPEAFKCRGTLHNSPYEKGGEKIEDCDALSCDALSISDRLRGFLSAFQAASRRHLDVIIGVRCKKHERYLQSYESHIKGDRAVVRLRGVGREDLKKMMTPLATQWDMKIYESGFSLEDGDLWGESQTILIIDPNL